MVSISENTLQSPSMQKKKKQPTQKGNSHTNKLHNKNPDSVWDKENLSATSMSAAHVSHWNTGAFKKHKDVRVVLQASSYTMATAGYILYLAVTTLYNERAR